MSKIDYSDITSDASRPTYASKTLGNTWEFVGFDHESPEDGKFYAVYDRGFGAVVIWSESFIRICFGDAVLDGNS